MAGPAGTRRAGASLTKLAMAVVLVVAGLVVTAESALAAPLLRARPSLPSPVTVGDAGIAASINLVNEYSPPDSSYGWNITSLRFAPSCKASTATGCTTPDSGCVLHEQHGNRPGGHRCAGTVFTFGAPDASGIQTITPSMLHLGAPGSATASCVIDFTMNVLKLPSDNNG